MSLCGAVVTAARCSVVSTGIAPSRSTHRPTSPMCASARSTTDRIRLSSLLARRSAALATTDHHSEPVALHWAISEENM